MKYTKSVGFFFIWIVGLMAFTDLRAQIIPYPLSKMALEGEFVLKAGMPIVAGEGLRTEAEFLSTYLNEGFVTPSPILASGNGIHLRLDENLSDSLGNEGYSLVIDGAIEIVAATSTGVFYGIQTLKQLLPRDFSDSVPGQVMISNTIIVDKPRFSWRAFMLDDCRNFMGEEVVKKMLDQMAMLKMNVFHWHLTDDQAWRIEIKKYPKLAEVGGTRKDTQLARGSDERVGKPQTGYYTQAQIKEIIRYAKERHIVIVPEIEMPGHAMAAIAAYPWIGSLGTTQEVPVTFGKMEDSFNVADPRVVGFLKDVLDEVVALFPGEAIHIGGDEVNYNPWKNSESITDYMRLNGLSTPMDLQIYFTNQISTYLAGKGKRMMGWNDILGHDIHNERDSSSAKAEQTLEKSSIVHFWKGDLGLVEAAAKGGYEVVNSNHWDTYLDYTYRRLPLSKSYAFDPIPAGLPEVYHGKILGLGTQIWTEYTRTESAMLQQVFPRLLAYAEVGWTIPKNKNYDRFLETAEAMKVQLNQVGIKFGDYAGK
ncbi:glycoside hydrolase family 20 [Echinicola strongylocentroti]|uniref:beta-N-acetylhexosaminidase n=1 Tax=Echinicola strongylocentroti TaxID=1795355 RepID=A0A2Z4IEF7_9BACT|nr:beta-N-acetylhexosaminidase [Echinicola strongylocentroti]AWW28868.1 glycoside hydrolase family 20 [Echinicola strongylocentroti]